MSKPACGDCGTCLSDGICPNCEEELFIAVWQEPEGMSEEFAAKVAEQEQAVARRKRASTR